MSCPCELQVVAGGYSGLWKSGYDGRLPYEISRATPDQTAGGGCLYVVRGGYAYVLRGALTLRR